MSSLSSAKLARVLVALVPMLALLPAGCDQEGKYPQDLTYPLRTDLIVKKTPDITPFYPDRPGEYDRHIAAIGKEGIGGETVNPQSIADGDRGELGKVLGDLFGKPAQPRVKGSGDESEQQVKELLLTDEKLEKGSILYRRHCLHCHGLNGDGRGSTGPWLNPHPRDYRLGLFKFISTAKNVRVAGDKVDRKPRRADLLRTLRMGIEGTSMPSFNTLSDDELDQIVSYVIHLSIRGEVELKTMRSLIDYKGRSGLRDESIRGQVEYDLQDLLTAWAGSNKTPNEPPSYPYKDDDERAMTASIRRGYALFTDPKGEASCIGCHYDFGRSVNFRYDDWGSVVRPANLTAGVFRGGRRPVDLYWRISGGIRGAQMPAADLKPEQYWDLVNFVRALPFPQMLPDDIRKSIYRTPSEQAEESHAAR